MKVVLVKENGIVRVLEGAGTVSAKGLSLRSRFTSGELKYYELDYPEDLRMPLDGFVAAINRNINILEKSAMIKEIK